MKKINTCIFCKKDISAHSPSEAILCIKEICMIGSEVGG